MLLLKYKYLYEQNKQISLPIEKRVFMNIINNKVHKPYVINIRFNTHLIFNVFIHFSADFYKVFLETAEWV